MFNCQSKPKYIRPPKATEEELSTDDDFACVSAEKRIAVDKLSRQQPASKKSAKQSVVHKEEVLVIIFTL